MKTVRAIFVLVLVWSVGLAVAGETPTTPAPNVAVPCAKPLGWLGRRRQARSERKQARIAELQQKREAKRQWLTGALKKSGIEKSSVLDILNSEDPEERALVDRALARFDPEKPLHKPDIYKLFSKLMEKHHRDFYSIRKDSLKFGNKARLTELHDKLIQSYVHELQAAQALIKDYDARGKLLPPTLWKGARVVGWRALDPLGVAADAYFLWDHQPIVPYLPEFRPLRWRILHDREFQPGNDNDSWQDVEARMREKYKSANDFELAYNAFRASRGYELAFAAQFPFLFIYGAWSTLQEEKKEQDKADKARQEYHQESTKFEKKAQDDKEFFDHALDTSEEEIRDLEEQRDPDFPNPGLEKAIAMKKAQLEKQKAALRAKAASQRAAQGDAPQTAAH